LGIGPVIVEPLLRERAAGDWTGLTRAEIEASWPGALADGTRPDGYEPDEEVYERGIAALAQPRWLDPSIGAFPR
jgi:broad specificity phosphatase PhoE